MAGRRRSQAKLPACRAPCRCTAGRDGALLPAQQSRLQAQEQQSERDRPGCSPPQGRQGSPRSPEKVTGAASCSAAPSPIPFPTGPAQPHTRWQPNKRPAAQSCPSSGTPSLTRSSHGTSLKALAAPEGKSLHILVCGSPACICHRLSELASRAQLLGIALIPSKLTNSSRSLMLTGCGTE